MNSLTMKTPDHIPSDLVVDFDFYNIPGTDVDLHQAWVNARDNAPDIFWTPRNGGHWVLTRTEDMEVIQNDYERFTHEVTPTIPVVNSVGRTLPVQCDPPEHTIYRMPVLRALLPQVVAKMEPMVRETAIELIESFVDKGECEFVSEFAQIFPIHIFLDLVDLPREDAEILLPCADAFVRGSNEAERLAGLAGINDYLIPWVKKRREEPGDDLISTIANIDVYGEKICFEEAVGFARTICLGGLDTVTGMLSFFVRFFATHPEHREQFLARIDDEDFKKHAVEELLRRHGIANSSRTARHDTEYKGIKFRAGDTILVPNLYIGLDDRVFDDPLTVDFNRPGPIKHGTFDVGPHICVGMHLARRELRIFLEEWFSRIPDFGLKPGTKPVMVTGMVNGMQRLEVAWPST